RKPQPPLPMATANPIRNVESQRRKSANNKTSTGLLLCASVSPWLSPMATKSKGKLFLCQWDNDSAEERAAELTAAGWQVKMETEEGERGFKNCKDFAPDIVLFDLAKKPSHSRATAR